IIKTLLKLHKTEELSGAVHVVVSQDEKEINIDYDHRKFIGRMALHWKGDHFLVYFADKATGIVTHADYSAAKSSYFRINNVKDARKFVKMYILMIELAALGRTRQS